MFIQERIQNDLKSAIRNKEKNRVKHLRVIIGELQRLEDKNLSNLVVTELLVSMGKKAKKNIEKYNFNVDDNKEFIKIIEEYSGFTILVEKASEEEIKTWIKENVVFNNPNSRMSMFGSIMNHFKSGADPKLVKKVLEEWED